MFACVVVSVPPALPCVSPSKQVHDSMLHPCLAAPPAPRPLSSSNPPPSSSSPFSPCCHALSCLALPCLALRVRACVQAVHIALQVARALAYLHPTILHRDLKPGNVLISNADDTAAAADPHNHQHVVVKLAVSACTSESKCVRMRCMGPCA